MLIKQIIREDADFESMKSVIAAKIKELPADNATQKALAEIEDLLKYVNAGGRIGIINGELKSINDPTVDAAQKQLARYLMSMEMTPAQRDGLFNAWREDEIVDRGRLLDTSKPATFADIFRGYNTNPAIKELVDDVMRIDALGQGKGEFGLSVLSKSINKQQGKGDLDIDGRDIEVKTTDGGAGRFTDQDVRPGPGFEAAANDLTQYTLDLGWKIPQSGININSLVKIYNEAEDKQTFMNKVEKVIGLIFNGLDVKPIISALVSGDVGKAKQEYSKASFNYYMSKKKDEGVLYIDLPKNKTVYFKDADELIKTGMRLAADTVYVTSVKDIRLPYPQISVVPTTRS